MILATSCHCNSSFIILSQLVWLPHVDYLYPVCRKILWPPLLLTLNWRPAETDLFHWSQWNVRMYFSISWTDAFGSTPRWTIFAAFLIEHSGFIFQQVVFKRYASVFKVKHHWLFISASLVNKGTRHSLKNPIYQTFFPKEWEIF